MWHWQRFPWIPIGCFAAPMVELVFTSHPVGRCLVMKRYIVSHEACLHVVPARYVISTSAINSQPTSWRIACSCGCLRSAGYENLKGQLWIWVPLWSHCEPGGVIVKQFPSSWEVLSCFLRIGWLCALCANRQGYRKRLDAYMMKCGDRYVTHIRPYGDLRRCCLYRVWICLFAIWFCLCLESFEIFMSLPECLGYISDNKTVAMSILFYTASELEKAVLLYVTHGHRQWAQSDHSWAQWASRCWGRISNIDWGSAIYTSVV